MPRLKTDYSKIIIYKLVKNDDYENANIYVGSTVDFTSRKYLHKNICCNENNKNHNCKVYQTIRENGGWNEWNMIEIEKYPCNDKREAEAREEWWRCELNANLNSKRAFITEEERKQYRIDNADKIKQYRIDNADKIKQCKKQYYINNADKMKQYYIDNADKIKQYRIDNADKIKQKRIDNADKIKQYRIDNADKIKKNYQCGCGGKYTYYSKSNHEKTKKHINYIK